ARLVPDKGLDILIEALNVIPDDLRARLQVLIGGVGDQAAHEKRVRDPGSNVIRFLGHVTDTGAYYAAADLFVLPSRHEPFGLVFIEAAQYALPSIGTRVGGIPEAIADGETGLLVPPNDVRGLRDCIVSLSRDDCLRRKLGEAAQRRARMQFTDDSMV